MQEQLKKKGKLSDEEQRLSDTIALLIEAAKSGNSSIFNKNGGGSAGTLRNLLGGLSGGRGLGQLFRGGLGGIDWSNFKPWDQNDARHLDRALNGPPGAFGEQIEAWKQGNKGNCATVAAIKMLLDDAQETGEPPFKATANGNGYDVVQQDGFEMRLSNQELAMAKAAANFRGPEEAKAVPNMVFAMAAKRAVMEGRNGSFSNALWDLNNGYDPRVSLRLVGLGHRTHRANPFAIQGQDAVVSNRGHAVFKSDQDAYDRYGRAFAYHGSVSGRRAVSAYTIGNRGIDPVNRELRELRSRQLGPLPDRPQIDLNRLGPDAWNPLRRTG
jgi:hypothetical protein